MLNLPVAIAMKTLQALLIMVLIPAVHLMQVSASGPRIDVPLAGDNVRGVVGIAGSTDVEGFDFSEVFFGFSSNDAWFSLGRQNQPVNNQIIVNWDTTIIPDGTYRIRVVVQRKDGSQVETGVDDIQVRNYSPAGQNNPSASASIAPPSGNYDPVLERTSTPLPRNPAAVNRQDLFASLRAGLVGTAGLFLILGLYLGLRWLNKRR
jgi:hypothetical protein